MASPKAVHPTDGPPQGPSQTDLDVRHRSSLVEVMESTKHRSTNIKSGTHTYDSDIIFNRPSCMNKLIQHPHAPMLRNWDLYIALVR